MRNAFFARVDEHLVALDHSVGQTRQVAVPKTVGLKVVAPVQQVGIVDLKFFVQVLRRLALQKASQHQINEGAGVVGALKNRPAEKVVNATARPALKTWRTLHGHFVRLLAHWQHDPATRALQPFGVQIFQHLVVALLGVYQILYRQYQHLFDPNVPFHLISMNSAIFND